MTHRSRGRGRDSSGIGADKGAWLRGGRENSTGSGVGWFEELGKVSLLPLSKI